MKQNSKFDQQLCISKILLDQSIIQDFQTTRFLDINSIIYKCPEPDDSQDSSMISVISQAKVNRNIQELNQNYYANQIYQIQAIQKKNQQNLQFQQFQMSQRIYLWISKLQLLQMIWKKQSIQIMNYLINLIWKLQIGYFKEYIKKIDKNICRNFIINMKLCVQDYLKIILNNLQAQMKSNLSDNNGYHFFKMFKYVKITTYNKNNTKINEFNEFIITSSQKEQI
ncbi:unnamed protein product [Paramecium sonneborni]|uniref:Uncharacterized protein n=1 Tax=Paramecium sonneborni TaxID=65129 RepID=A0A8S1RKS8_9CILI|nr:unnamed protein product [Paramecium sonneborni]